MKKNGKTPLQMAAISGTIGFEILACILIGAWVGRFLDEHAGKAHLWLAIGVLFGLFSGMISAFFTLKSFIKD